MDDTSHDELYEHHFFEVEKKHDLIRIDKFLLLRLPNTSRNKIQKSILSGYVSFSIVRIPPNTAILAVASTPFVFALLKVTVSL